jgi:hypothetical protein
VPSEHDCAQHDGRPSGCGAKPYCSYANGMCHMWDLSKHSCTAATDATSCRLIKDAAGSSVCAYVDSCSDPCSACHACLGSVNTGLLPLTLSLSTGVDVRVAFYAWCIADGYSAAGCIAAGDSIQASPYGNPGKRAGAVCSLLGPCGSSSCASTAASAKARGSTPVGRLDKCTVEGVAAGRRLEAPAGAVAEEEAAAAGLCLEDDDCEGAGHVCSKPDNGTLVCSCSDGVDSCQRYGTCMSHCRDPSFKAQLQEHNSNVGIAAFTASCRSAFLECAPLACASIGRNAAANPLACDETTRVCDCPVLPTRRHHLLHAPRT